MDDGQGDFQYRYAQVEEELAACARMMPSVVRFHALGNVLTRGVDLASYPPVDDQLTARSWFVGCLRMMAEDVLPRQTATWKRSLTIADRQIITDSFLRGIRALVKWCQLVGGADVFQSSVIYSLQALKNDGLFTLDGEGNLLYNNYPVVMLCRGIDAKVVVCRPAEPYLKDPQLDSTWLCKEAGARIVSVYNYLRARIAAYENATDAAMKRAALALDPYDNQWFSYYVREYCVPTTYHLNFADQKIVNVEQLKYALGFVDAMSQGLGDLVAAEAGDDTAVQLMVGAWGEVKAKYIVRALDYGMPTYSEQETFAVAFGRFQDCFAGAVNTIGGERRMTIPCIASETEDIEIPDFPDKGDDKGDYREAIKDYIHHVAVGLVKSKIVDEVHDYPSAHAYILKCSQGKPYFSHCKLIRKAFSNYGWVDSTQFTIVKGGGKSNKKPNLKRRAIVRSNKKARQKDWEGVGLDDPDRLQ